MVKTDRSNRREGSFLLPISDAEYHKDHVGTDGKPYLSSSMMKGCFNGKVAINKTPTTSLSFGRLFHMAIEYTLCDLPFTLMANAEFKKTDFYKEVVSKDKELKELNSFYYEKEFILVAMPSEVIQLKAMLESFDILKRDSEVPLWDKGTDEDERRNFYYESAIFSTHEELVEYDHSFLPEGFEHILDVLRECHAGLKTKFDFVTTNLSENGKECLSLDLFDWKTTTKESVKEMEGQSKYGYYYPFSMMVYLLNLYVKGYIHEDTVVRTHTCMFSKSKEVQPPVVFKTVINEASGSHIGSEFKRLFKHYYWEVYSLLKENKPVVVEGTL